MATKEIDGYIKLQVPAGQAAPSPTVGPALGQRGLNSKDFCTEFNERTKNLEPGVPLSVKITCYKNKSFDFAIKSPLASFLLKKAAGVEAGSATANTKKVGKVTRAQLEEIARMKQADLTAAGPEAALRILAGTARSMGLEVEGL